jgi:type I restriction enzyme M protein
LDIENQLKETIGNLTNLIDDLEGDEFDMKGLEEFKKLLGGD